MAFSSPEKPKSKMTNSSQPRAVLGPRRAHGDMAWMNVSTDDTVLYQPQDGATESQGLVADMTSRVRRMIGEPEDARITGGTRSLMRRLTGLNMGKSVVRRAQSIVQPVSNGLPLTNANVA